MLELARESDWEAVLRLSRQVHDLHLAWRPDLFQACEISLPKEEFLEAISRRMLYVARVDGRIAGYVHLDMVQREDPRNAARKEMIIQALCVDKASRGQGIGRAVLTDVRALAKAFRCQQITLGVYPQNDDAVAFYQKCGFYIRSIKMDCKV